MFEYKVVDCLKVTDGDTLKLEVDLGFGVHITETFRVWGVDAPELRGSTLEAGRAAKDFVQGWINTALLSGKLRVKTDKMSTKAKADKYGRWIADLFYWDDTRKVCLSEELIDSGHAEPFMDDGFFTGGRKESDEPEEEISEP